MRPTLLESPKEALRSNAVGLRREARCRHQQEQAVPPPASNSSLEYLLPPLRPTPGPLHLLFSLPDMLFWIFSEFISLLFSGLSFSVTSSERPSLVTPPEMAGCPCTPSCPLFSLFPHLLVFFVARTLLKIISYAPLLLAYRMSPQ